MAAGAPEPAYDSFSSPVIVIWSNQLLLLSQESASPLSCQGDLQSSPRGKGTGRAGWKGTGRAGWAQQGKEPCSDQGDGDGPGQMDVAPCAGGVVRSYRLPPVSWTLVD